jgi:hypothetical protein
MAKFDWNMLSNNDQHMAMQFLRGFREPDLIIAPDGNPYLYRWHITNHEEKSAKVFLHVQVSDDPERPLHDHPWDNVTVMLAGVYHEIMSMSEGPPSPGSTTTFIRAKGDVIHRKACWPHRLLLPNGWKYAMTLFTVGPKIRGWGFWLENGWVPFNEVIRLRGNISIHVHSESFNPTEGM